MITITLNKAMLPKQQCGTALVMALLFLLILTILGVFGMSNARLENMMAGNHSFQAVALSNAELVLNVAEQDLLDSLDGAAKPACYYSTTETIDPSQADWSFPNPNCTYTLPNGESALYVIEYAGSGKDKCSEKVSDAALCDHFDFLITTQATSNRGARRIVQVVYQSSSPP